MKLWKNSWVVEGGKRHYNTGIISAINPSEAAKFYKVFGKVALITEGEFSAAVKRTKGKGVVRVETEEISKAKLRRLYVCE